MKITKLWIEEGCISCQLCSDMVPQVFQVDEGEDCIVKPEAGGLFAEKAEDIVEAARDCPVEVIQYDDAT